MNQTFKTAVDKSILFMFLEKTCEKNEKYYIFNSPAYKRGELNNANMELLEELATALLNGLVLFWPSDMKF